MRRHYLPSGAAGGRGTLRRGAAGLLLGALLLSSSTALADARTEAKSHFKKGMLAISEGKYEEGISELQRAYEILPHPNVLYNIARAYAESGDLEGAVATYKKYLEGSPPDRDEVSQVVVALESRLERQKAIAAAASQAAPTPERPATPAPGTTPGTTTPGTTPGTAVATTPTPTPIPQPPPGPAVDVGKAKTEEVFEESVVTASKGAQSPLDAPNSTSIVTEQDIRLSGITKIAELLRHLAGVDIMEVNGSQSEVSLRGFNRLLSNKVLFLINGRSTAIDLLGTTFWASFPIGVEDIERIEVVRGPGSALYGADAFNGVVNIITKAPGEGRSGFNVAYGDHNQTHGTIWATGRDKEFAYRLSGGYDYLPRWSNEVPQGRADVTLAGAPFPDQNTSQQTVRLNTDFTRDLAPGVVAGLGGGFLNGSFQVGGYSPLSNVMLAATGTDLTAFLNSKHIEIKGFWNRFEGRNELAYQQIGQSIFPAHFNLNVVDVQAQYIDEERFKSFSNSLHIGIGYRFRQADWTWLDSTHSENFESAYVHDEARFGRYLAVVGDFRGDYVPYLGQVVFSPKGSILIHPTKTSTIRGIVATAFRIPNFLESYIGIQTQLPFAGGELLARGTQADLPNPPKLNPENVITEELGYLNQDSDYLVFDSAVFHNSVKNLIDLAPTHAITVGDVANPGAGSGFDTQTGRYPIFFTGWENQCQSYDVWGGEIGLRTFPTEGLDVYANYTLMGVTQDNSQCTADQKAFLTPDSRTSTHKVNAGVQVRTNVHIDGSIDFSYVSPQTWSEQVISVQQQRNIEQSFAQDGYSLLNARVGYRFLKNQAEISAVGFNILNDQHREHPFGQLIGQRFMGMFNYRF